MFRLLVFAVLMLAGGVVAVRFVDQAARPPAAAAMPVQPAAQPANSRSMVVRAGEGGHFGVEARVDGRRLQFLIDTGASQVVLRASDAAKLGLRPSARDYSIRISTANGEGRAARVDLRMVEVGDIIVRDLPALVVADEALATNLLGMSFLARVRWSHERGKLLIEQ